MEKVKLPREVAEAIEKLRNAGNTDFYIIGRAFQGEMHTPTDEMKVIIRYIAQNTGDFDEEHEKGYTHIMQALVNGYEVEQTPEDKVAELFRFYSNSSGDGDTYKTGYNIGARNAIKQTLDALEINIEGVTDQ